MMHGYPPYPDGFAVWLVEWGYGIGMVLGLAICATIGAFNGSRASHKAAEVGSEVDWVEPARERRKPDDWSSEVSN